MKILQQAARDFLSTKPGNPEDSKGRLKPSWKTLIALLIHEFFHPWQRYEPPIASDPLVDALLFLSDTDCESLSRKPGYCDVLALLQLCIDEGLPHPRTASGGSIDFLEELRSQWMSQKRMRVEASTESLMPWSATSILEGSLKGKFHPIALTMSFIERCFRPSSCLLYRLHLSSACRVGLLFAPVNPDP